MIAIFSTSSRGVAQLTILHSFGDGTVTGDGANPSAGLIQAPDGNFYGVTLLKTGTTHGFEGTVFQITPAGVLRVIHTFTRRVNSRQPLLWYSGSLVGINQGKTKTNRFGAVFGLAESPNGHWAISNWYLFSDTGGGPEAAVAPLILGSDGQLYGTSELGGSKGLGIAV